MIRAAVVGLGQIGSRFDEDSKRSQVWTHVGAYLSLPERIALVGVCDVDSSNRERFMRRCPGVPVFHDIDRLIQDTAPDVLSIATPAPAHAAQVIRAIEAGLNVVWCEKPLTDVLDKAEEMAALAGARGTRLFVSYVRRWMPLWQRARQVIDNGEIGAVRSLRVSVPNRLLTMGSHGLDLLAYLGGPAELASAEEVTALREDNEPAVAAVLRFTSGAVGLLQPTGFKGDLVVEAEVYGAQGRLRIVESTGTLEISRFETSANYAGYRELSAPERETHPGFADDSPFCRIAEEIADYLDGLPVPIRCGAAEALQVQSLVDVAARAVSVAAAQG